MPESKGPKSGGKNLSGVKGHGITRRSLHGSLGSQEWGQKAMQGSKGLGITNKNLHGNLRVSKL